MTDIKYGQLPDDYLDSTNKDELIETLRQHLKDEVELRLQETYKRMTAERKLAALKAGNPAEARCKSCGANDFEMPCAYPGEGKHGCLRDARLKQGQGEPVAWLYKGDHITGDTLSFVYRTHYFKKAGGDYIKGIPLYTSAPTIPEGWKLVRDYRLIHADGIQELKEKK